MTVVESADSIGGVDCWAETQRAADSQPVNAAAAKLRARELTWLVDAHAGDAGYAKVLEIPANGVKTRHGSPLELIHKPSRPLVKTIAGKHGSYSDLCPRVCAYPMPSQLDR